MKSLSLDAISFATGDVARPGRCGLERLVRPKLVKPQLAQPPNHPPEPDIQMVNFA
jgi:hypothetical protein